MFEVIVGVTGRFGPILRPPVPGDSVRTTATRGTGPGTVSVVNSSVVVVAIGVVLAVVAYVGHRRREGTRLDREAALAGRLRELAGGDPVRLAAVDEFETRIYQRLFGVSTIGPRATATAWAFLATVLSVVGALSVQSGSGLLRDVVYYVLLALTVVSAIVTAVLLTYALHAAISLPRISFDSPYTEASDSTDS